MECISSYDVKALFTSVPVDHDISIMKQILQQYSQLHKRTFMSIQHIATLLEFCLKILTSSFRIGIMNRSRCSHVFPTSPIVSNLFMEEFESKAISTAPNPPKLWLRYVDDTFVIQKAEYSKQFLHHISSIDPHIQFTTEDPDSNAIFRHISLPQT